MKNFFILILVLGLAYTLGVNYNKTKRNESSKYIAIATRMIFAQQCSETMDQYFGKSSNSTMMSKEHIQMSNICYKIGDQISKEIENTKEISEDNIVEVVDKAMGKVKRDLVQNLNSKSSENEDLSESKPINDFI